MRVLLVSDLHYDLRKLDHVLQRAPEHDLLAVAGDLLNVGSPVPLDAQAAVVLEYLARAAESTTVVACSGNHDLDHRGDDGEKASRWIAEAREAGVHVDGDTAEVGDWQATACAWWEGPSTLGRLQAGLEEVSRRRTGRWLWVWHGPPDGPLSWTGSRHHGDPELPALVDRYAPDVVLCGHVHQAPFAPDGGWHARLGSTWLFNAGHQMGPVPATVSLDLVAGTARWESYAGSDEVALGPAQ